ncbi:phosphatidylinositol 3 and 4-kinase-like protein [Phytophthora sojae]|uniref:1-phosphatidylinositol 4-kinase n=1 Tax=Phytophthora sojae (strain P6497) TaxID=1094619 RepID=G5AEN0_PHYSP|nr:phosphatidylinositol 3 and 4-kinase-like protein [Phytophthora sojae]EGZ05670.1 phosphatidylinositol 3 and 4-kinase-like protein [Phytophthora sojae]|eukprot:XP_009538531.1 phosphatidylinositol 3 and 4-kinase-like protein [Phytophthora sojae]
MRAVTRSSFSFGSSRSSSKKQETDQDASQDANQTDTKNVLSNSGAAVTDVVAAAGHEAGERKMEGFLVFRKRGQTMLVFKHKPSDSASPGTPKKQITVVGVKDAMELETSVRVALLGSGAPGSYDNALVISSHKSKLVVAEADTHIEKGRWLHALSTIYLTSGENEKAFFQSVLSADGFDAHMAVTLLHKHRTNAMATELVLDRLASYAEQNVDDVEFYIQQIVHLTVNTELAATDKLVHLLLSICRAKAYVEHLGNCIHLALQIFWLLEAKIADNDPKTYNLCAKLLMSIEAKVVNQQFELPSTQTADDVTRRLMDIPDMEERLEQMSVGIQSKEEVSRPAEVLAPPESDASTLVSPPMTPGKARAQQPALLLQWMEKERQKRYKYFHQQRDFVKALSDISERMRAVDPPQNRKKLLPDELKALVVPDMAYVPLGRVSDPFCRITRVLTDEGTVFSTHSRAPCLLCFEVIEDQVNSAGQRRLSVQLKGLIESLPGASSDSTQPSLEAEVAGLIKKFAINGQLICVENPSALDEDEDDDAEIGNGEDEAVGNRRSTDSPVFALHDIDSALSSPTSTIASDDSMDSMSEMSGAGSQQLQLIRGYSKTAYEMGLSKLLSASEVFGESWQAKKERIRAASPFGHLPGWNVISLISKSNDDIRQEVFAMQLITTFQRIFRESGLSLWLRPYRIVSTGRTSGLLETITDAQSLDALKKRSTYAGLRAHFESTYGAGTEAFKKAQRNFLHSLAAYSVVCYLLQIKDRHNGNILLDTEGHLVHIDFGFMLGIAPGRNWSFETAPFKLTKEMVAVLGGVSSPLFGEFVQLVALGLLAAQRQAEKVVALVEIMMHNSTFPCFQGRDVSRDLQKLRGRFLLHCSTEKTVKAVVKMMRASYKNKWTKRYDQFQKITNGIVP